MSTGIRVASLDDIPEGEGIAIDKTITGTADNIALLRDDDGTVWALDDTCTHEEAPWPRGGWKAATWSAHCTRASSA